MNFNRSGWKNERGNPETKNAYSNSRLYEETRGYIFHINEAATILYTSTYIYTSYMRVSFFL
jgi:hypothetical protein